MNYPKGCLTAREKVPEHTLAALDDYLVKHWAPGDFLKAVLSNDLFNALGQADDLNRVALFDICAYIYNHVTPEAWGSPTRVEAWLKEEVQ